MFRGVALLYGVCRVSFVVADVLDHFCVGKILELDRDGERLGVGFRIVDCDLDIHVSEVAASESFDGAKRLAVRPAAVIERTGVIESLSRSIALTRERRWRVFGAVLVAGVITVVVGAVVGGIFGVITGANSTLFNIVVWAVTAAAQAFSACVVATLYYNLRREKEGVGIEQIAQVFD